MKRVKCENCKNFIFPSLKDFLKAGKIVQPYCKLGKRIMLRSDGYIRFCEDFKIKFLKRVINFIKNSIIYKIL